VASRVGSGTNDDGVQEKERATFEDACRGIYRQKSAEGGPNRGRGGRSRCVREMNARFLSRAREERETRASGPFRRRSRIANLPDEGRLIGRESRGARFPPARKSPRGRNELRDIERRARCEPTRAGEDKRPPTFRTQVRPSAPETRKSLAELCLRDWPLISAVIGEISSRRKYA